MTAKPRKDTALKESDRWDKFSVQELIDMSEPVEGLPVDRRPRKAVSLRIDEDVIEETKKLAGHLGLGYQTLFRMWVIEGLRKHRRSSPRPRTSRKRAA